MSRNLNDPANWHAWLRSISKDPRCEAKASLAMLTGQDKRALGAFAHAVSLYAAADDQGADAALDAMADLLSAMQEKCWPFARELIAQSMDWHHRHTIWTQLERRRAR